MKNETEKTLADEWSRSGTILLIMAGADRKKLADQRTLGQGDWKWQAIQVSQ